MIGQGWCANLAHEIVVYCNVFAIRLFAWKKLLLKYVKWNCEIIILSLVILVGLMALIIACSWYSNWTSGIHWSFILWTSRIHLEFCYSLMLHTHPPYTHYTLHSIILFIGVRCGVGVWVSMYDSSLLFCCIRDNNCIVWPYG